MKNDLKENLFSIITVLIMTLLNFALLCGYIYLAANQETHVNYITNQKEAELSTQASIRIATETPESIINFQDILNQQTVLFSIIVTAVTVVVSVLNVIYAALVAKDRMEAAATKEAAEIKKDMESATEKLINKTVAHLTQENKDLLDKQEEKFQNKILALEETYKKTLENFRDDTKKEVADKTNSVLHIMEEENKVIRANSQRNMYFILMENEEYASALLYGWRIIGNVYKGEKFKDTDLDMAITETRYALEKVKKTEKNDFELGKFIDEINTINSKVSDLYKEYPILKEAYKELIKYFSKEPEAKSKEYDNLKLPKPSK
ncbi:MAG: hypothetical protein ACOZAO_01460 [Patescibacteria group bacterium]